MSPNPPASGQRPFLGGLLAVAGAVRRRWRRIWTTPLEELPDIPPIIAHYRAWTRHPLIERIPGGWRYRGRDYPDVLHVGGASAAILSVASQYCQGTGIDVGAGFWPFPGATPIDAARGPGLATTLDDVSDGSVDYVFSSHCLEHIEDWRAELERWCAKVRPGGVVFLYLPHATCEIWLPGSPFVGDGHKWSPTAPILVQYFTALGWTPVEVSETPDGMQSFHVCARKPV